MVDRKEPSTFGGMPLLGIPANCVMAVCCQHQRLKNQSSIACHAPMAPDKPKSAFVTSWLMT